MDFPFQVEEATFVGRPNRFVVLARLASGDLVRAHCADPGRLQELLAPGCKAFISPANIAGRRTQYDLRFVAHPATGVLVSLDTRLPNQVFAEALAQGQLPQFGRVALVQREVSAPANGAGIHSRFDFLLTDGDGRRCWVEVKSVTLVEDGWAEFPDAPTERGRRHLSELAQIAANGQDRAAVVFVVQRPDARVLRPRWSTDPAFGAALVSAHAEGVELYAYTCTLSIKSICLHRQIRIDLHVDQPRHLW
jgi:sugar fermentation stimulation protein A